MIKMHIWLGVQIKGFSLIFGYDCPPPPRKAKHIGFGINWNLLPSIDIIFVKCIEA